MEDQREACAVAIDDAVEGFLLEDAAPALVTAAIKAVALQMVIQNGMVSEQTIKNLFTVSIDIYVQNHGLPKRTKSSLS